MTWAWLAFKNLGIRITARFGGAPETEKAAFRKKWDAPCAACRRPRWNHLTVGHRFKEVA